MLNDDRLYDIMRTIDSLSREHGYPPSVREIGVVLGIKSTSTVQMGIDILKRRGWATNNARLARSLRLTEEGARHINE